MKQFPKRHKNHILESKSEKFFKDHLPEEWVAEKPIDYGIDYKVEIIIDEQVIGENFSVQLKAHDKLGKDNLISVNLDRTTINLYLARLEPILIICYIKEQNEAYYSWFTERSVDLSRNQKTHSIRFNPDNKISTLDWNEIATYVKSIFSRRHLLHAFPLIDFSQMGIEEKNASTYYINGNYEAANIIYKELNKKEPNAYLLNSIAMCHYGQYQYKDALNYINQALNLSSSTEILINKASILSEFGKETNNKAMMIEARAIFSKSIQNQDSYHQHYNYATTLSWLQENKLSEFHFKEAIKLNPNHAEAWKNLGEIYHRQKKYSEELDCYDNALKIKPKMPEALMSKGISLIRDHNDYKNGLNYLQKTVDSDPDLFSKFEESYFWFAHANTKLGNEDIALNYIENGLNYYPGNPYLLNLKRDYFKDNWSNKDNLRNEAVKFMHYRLELEPGDMIAVECLLKIYLQEKKMNEILVLLKQYTFLFKYSDITSFDDYFDFEPFPESFFHHYDYYFFRKENPLKAMIGENTNHFFLEYCELIGLQLFHEASGFITKNLNEKHFEDKILIHLYTHAVHLYPKASTYYIKSKKEEIESFGSELTKVSFILMPMIASKEIARIISNFQIKYKLNSDKISLAISSFDEGTYNQKMSMSCIEAIQKRYHFFPE